MRGRTTFDAVITRLVLAFSLIRAVAHADGGDAGAWTQRIRDHYRHFSSIEPVAHAGAWKDTIKLRCGAQTIRRLRVEPWGVTLRLKQPRKNLFFDWMDLTVRKLADAHEDAYASYRAVSGGACNAASYAFEAILQTGPYLVTLSATCTQMQTLFPYEVADLVELARTAGFGVPDVLVYDRCGQPELALRPTDEVLAEAKKTRQLYEHTLPKDREARRTAAH